MPELEARDLAEYGTALPPKYAAVRVLGRGGMGVVVEARHTQLGHRVAIKMLGEDLRTHPPLLARFEREARAVGALSSPHVVKIFDVDKTDAGAPFMVMELLEGSDLGQVLQREGPLPVPTAVRCIVEACDAIAEAHRLGIVHRDLKPSNLFLDRETQSIKVLDFGIAKRVTQKEAAITAALVPLGTPQYMSPEQVRCAKDVDARTDIWSLGATLFELLCGRPPYDHDLAQACVIAIVTDPVPDPRNFRPEIPRGLAAVILRALAKDADERFQSVEELVRALAPFTRGDVFVPRRARAYRLRAVGAIAAAIALPLLASGQTPRSTEAAAFVSPPLAMTRAEVTNPTPDAPPPSSPRAYVRSSAPSRERSVRGSVVVHGGLSGPGF